MGLAAEINLVGNVARNALDLLQKADVGVHLHELVPRVVAGANVPADNFCRHDYPRNNLRATRAE